MTKLIVLVAASALVAACNSGQDGPSDALASGGTPRAPLALTVTTGIWPSGAVPTVVDGGSDKSVELGVKFRSDVDGYVSGIRFYKAEANTGTHVANLWSASGTKVASATFVDETASGWQEVRFATPVAIAANTVYVASYHANIGHYSCDQTYFASGYDHPPLHALADGVSGRNGVYAYGTRSKFPTSGWKESNYWVDVVFTTTLDTTPPQVTELALPSAWASLTVPVTTFTAVDDVAVTGYLLTETATTPSATASGWAVTAPASYTFATAGAKTLYAWAKDAAGNVSASQAATVEITLPVDVTAPTVDTFSIPSTSATLVVPISGFTASDAVGVTGYLVNESSATPSPTGSGWLSSPPTSYVFATAGTKTLYAWARDAAGNVSAGKSATVIITLQTGGGPEAPGWYAGDMHVHRSCGGSPESVSSLFADMSTHELAFVSLLADMGNGEVQNAATDLPLVNGTDASISTPGRILHWDAEWHWDPIYYQYAHQALGGHVVALGVSSARQTWQEYTYPVLSWAHQAGGIAGFAHMQYLDDAIPSGLTCCTPIEYPVEVALGAADFISEDVADATNDSGMNPEAAIQAYYRLLNCGFRPGLAAGTDYPCNGYRPLGSLLTYGQVADGQVTYRSWIDAIKNGRTVVSRNAHNEFLALVVNGSAGPGDELQLSGGGSVAVTVTWTATGSYSGTLELVSNGAVVARRTASVTPSAPATLTATVPFPKSGWLAARRMAGNGHQVHTAAVFVLVDGKPIRASATDASFYVQWMDRLLANTSPGGAWASYFPTQRAAAQGRYSSARAVYQQILADATPPPPPAAGQTIFTTQVPTLYERDQAYELGTRFYADAPGQITQVRLWTGPLEGGSHTVRIWRVSDRAVVAGPYTWNITAGTEGWQTFPLPAAVSITASTDYIVAVSNSADRYYASGVSLFNSAIGNGNLHTYVGSGVWTTALGTMPTNVYQNEGYFRDVVFTKSP